jgi:hypothetical protein
MKTQEILTLQALKFKQNLLNDQSDLADGSPVWLQKVDPGADDTRNICALISVPLFEEIDRLLSVLSMSKRRFVELALLDLAVKANEAIAGVGLTNVTSTSIGSVPTDEV